MLIGHPTFSQIRQSLQISEGATPKATIQYNLATDILQLVAEGSGSSISFITNETQRIFISPAGLVGIGTASPSQTLELNGNLKAGQVHATQFCDPAGANCIDQTALGPAGSDTLSSLSCGDGEVPRWNAGSDQWECSDIASETISFSLGTPLTASIPTNQIRTNTCGGPTGTLNITQAGLYQVRLFASAYRYTGNAASMTIHLIDSDSNTIMARSASMSLTGGGYMYAQGTQLLDLDVGTYTVAVVAVDTNSCATTSIDRIFAGTAVAERLSAHGISGSASNSASSSMIDNWPDSIVCHDWGGTSGTFRVYMLKGKSNTGEAFYSMPGETDYNIIYNSNGSFQSGFGSLGECAGKSIADLIEDGQAFHLVGGSSGSSRISGEVAAFDLTECPPGWSEYTPARGRFIRGIDPTGTNDPDGIRSLGSTQEDAFQGHTMGLSPSQRLASQGGGYAPISLYSGSGGGAYTQDLLSIPSYFTPQTDGVSGTPRTANETRPKNVALLYCRKD